MIGKYVKRCAWCRREFTTNHGQRKCCSSECSRKQARRKNRRHWPAYYRRVRERLLAYYKAYHLAHREQRVARSREYQRRRVAAFRAAGLTGKGTPYKPKPYRPRNPIVTKVMEEWQCSAAQARRWIRRGSFPP